MNKIKRIISITLLMIIVFGNIIFPVISEAKSNEATLYATHRFGSLLTRNGAVLTCLYIVHNEDGIEYPAYCLNLELDGATQDFSYTVSTDNLLTDMELWRTVVNGFPYKTPEELGCQTNEEAYLATRQAVYCSIYNRDPESYGAVQTEAGQRTLNALKQIVYTARNSTETKKSATLTINTENSVWQLDSMDSNFISKEYSVTANAKFENYTINLSGNLVEGIKIVDQNNNKKDKFSAGEKFKILIPIKNIEQDGNFTITANGKVATMPVLYGKAPSSTLQNVAVTGNKYENGEGTKTEYYFKNKTKIVIIKQDQETKNMLEGVKFQLLNENKEVKYSELVTNNEGKIIIENLIPGKYYVQEMETLEGYDVYNRLIEVDLKLNEETKITVNNLLNKEQPKNETSKSELEVEQIKTNKEIVQEQKKYSKITLPITGM